MLLGDDLDATVHLVLDIDLTELLLNLGKVFGERLDSLGVHADDDLIVGVGFALEGHDGLFAIGGVDVNDGDIGDNADDDSAVLALVSSEIDKLNAQWPDWKRVKHIVLRKGEFNKTTGMKIRRFVEENKLAD